VKHKTFNNRLNSTPSREATQDLKIYDYITVEGTSLPLEIEKRLERLKEEYLEWVYVFGESPCDGKKVKEYLTIDGLPLWWLTLIAEKSPYKTPFIYRIFKLRTIELLVQEGGSKNVYLFSDDEALRGPLFRWARERNIEVVWERIGAKTRPPEPWKGRIYKKSPHILQSIFWPFYLWWRKVRKVDKVKSFEANRATIITYFPDIELKDAEAGRYRSRYWNGLHDLLDAMNLRVNWIFMYVESKESSFEEALSLKNKFSKSSSDKFLMLEEFMTMPLLFSALKDYFRLYFRGRRLLRADFFKLPGSEINFYDICKRDWETSVIGQVLIENITCYRTFQRLFDNLPNQHFCLYLCEMIAWEKALCNVCKKRGVFTIGFQHSSLRLMDLRYFHRPLAYMDDSLPLPDLLAVNGETAKESLLKNGYPERNLFLVEALRYLYLLDLKIKKSHPKTLLVLTSYIKEESKFQLGLLFQALTDLNFERIWVKPHPYTPVEDIINELGMANKVEVRRDPLSILLSEADVVFACNETTANIESVYLGIPTVSIIHDGINMHPLLGQGVPLIYSPQGLIAFTKKPVPTKLKKDIFLLDKSLKMWKKILETYR